MLVLALETATEHASVVLAEDDRELAAWRAVTQQDLCLRLAAEVTQVLQQAGAEPGDVTLVTVGLGPGSFTSLRVGLATAKGFCLARGVPLVGVPALEAIAWQVRDRVSGTVCPVIDARRGELYAGLFQVAGRQVVRQSEEFVARPAELGKRLAALGQPVSLLGQVDKIQPDALAELQGDRIEVLADPVAPDALAIACIGRQRYPSRPLDEIDSARPIYVRRSYAEERFDIDLGLR